MKLTATITLALAASVSAFAPKTPSSSVKSSASKMSDMPAQTDLVGYYTNLEQRNAELDVENLPASMKFDPFKFSDNRNGLSFPARSRNQARPSRHVGTFCFVYPLYFCCIE